MVTGSGPEVNRKWIGKGPEVDLPGEDDDEEFVKELSSSACKKR